MMRHTRERLIIENAIVGVADALTYDRSYALLRTSDPGRAVPRVVATTEPFRWIEVRY
jgi:hypothetical protein